MITVNSARYVCRARRCVFLLKIFIRDRESHVQFDTSNTANATARRNENPLLDFSDLPLFDAIKPEHVTPAIDDLLAAKAAVDHAAAPETQVTWHDFVETFERASERLGRAWGIVSHLNNVADTPELRATYDDNLPKVTEF